MPWQDPGADHPNAHLTWAEAADRLGVPDDRVQAWRALGLPGDDHGIDGFTLANWTAAQVRAEVPALARRWRQFLALFRPFALGQDHTRDVAIARRHRLVREPAGDVAWALPRLSESPAQTVRHDQVDGLGPGPTHHRGAAGATVAGRAQVALRAWRAPQPDLVPLVEDLVAGFTYGYRQHRPQDRVEDHRTAGTCLDLALVLGEHLAARGRPWRLVSGVVARTAVANPHFWIETEVAGGGWVPLDPSLPLLARTFGDPAQDDWRAWVRAWTGGRDPGVVTLCRGEAPQVVPGGATLGSVAGEAVVAGTNWWPCLDWVCGVCTWSFGS